MKNEVDTTKTADEINMIKKMEQQQREDEHNFKQTRQQALAAQIKDLENKFNRKTEMVKTRRKTITKLHEFEEKDFGEEPPEMKLPDIHLKSNL